MPKTMKAAVVHAFGKALAIEEVPVPTPGLGQVLVRIVASGVCHTDLHAADGDWPIKPTLPFIAAVDVDDGKLALAKSLGAEVTVNAATSDAASEMQRIIGGAQGVLITAVSIKAFQQAIGILPGGDGDGDANRGVTGLAVGLLPTAHKSWLSTLDSEPRLDCDTGRWRSYPAPSIDHSWRCS